MKVKTTYSIVAALMMILLLIAVAGAKAQTDCVRADLNNDTRLDIDDVSFLIAYFWTGGIAPAPCVDTVAVIDTVVIADSCWSPDIYQVLDSLHFRSEVVHMPYTDSLGLFYGIETWHIRTFDVMLLDDGAMAIEESNLKVSADTHYIATGSYYIEEPDTTGGINGG